MEIHDHSEKSMAELMKQEQYTPEELATLLDMNVNQIRNACYEGSLDCQIINHDIISITRESALRWEKTR